MNVWVLGLLFTPVFVIIGVNRNRRRRTAITAATVEVHVDDHGARRTLADGRHEEITWPEVTEVDVFTTRKGPHKAAGGAVVLYGTAERGCVIPLDHLEDSGLLVHVGRLEGFQVSTIIDALRADERREAAITGNALQAAMPKPWQTTTVCWRRPDVTGPTPFVDDVDDHRGRPEDDPSAS